MIRQCYLNLEAALGLFQSGFLRALALLRDFGQLLLGDKSSVKMAS